MIYQFCILQYYKFVIGLLHQNTGLHCICEILSCYQSHMFWNILKIHSTLPKSQLKKSSKTPILQVEQITYFWKKQMINRMFEKKWLKECLNQIYVSNKMPYQFYMLQYSKIVFQLLHQNTGLHCICEILSCCQSHMFLNILRIHPTLTKFQLKKITNNIWFHFRIFNIHIFSYKVDKI